MVDLQTKEASKGSVLYVTMICVVAALGGFLLGFDTAVISGALNPLIQYFQIDQSPSMQGWLVSSIILGSVFGAAISGYLADNYGRKNILLVTGVLFFISAAGSAIATSFTFFISTRLVGGVAVGIAAMVAPLYISEVSPPRIRGRMVSMYQLAITVGILVAYFSNDYLRMLSENIQSAEPSKGFIYLVMKEIWRPMLGSEVLPALLFLILILMVPESPRYLMMRNKEQAAWRILVRVSGELVARRELIDIKEAMAKETGSVKQLFMPGLQKATFIAIFLSIISQFSGIDIVLHYGPVILERAGFSFAESLYSQTIFGVVLVLFTLLAMWKVDAIGRRVLLVIGNAGVFVSLIAMGYFFKTQTSSETGLIISISFFIGCFAFSLGPIPWIIMSEIFPTKVRGRAMAIATLTLFAANWFVAQVFPVVSALMGEQGTFWLLASFSLPTFFFVWKILPETNGKSLEEVQKLWEK